MKYLCDVIIIHFAVAVKYQLRADECHWQCVCRRPVSRGSGYSFIKLLWSLISLLTTLSSALSLCLSLSLLFPLPGILSFSHTHVQPQSAAKERSFSWYYLWCSIGMLVGSVVFPIIRQTVGFMIALFATAGNTVSSMIIMYILIFHLLFT